MARSRRARSGKALAAVALLAAAAAATVCEAGTTELLALRGSEVQLASETSLHTALDPDGKGFLDANLYLARSRADGEALHTILQSRGLLGDLASVAFFEEEEAYKRLFGRDQGPVLVQRGVEFEYCNATYEARTAQDGKLQDWLNKSLRTSAGWVNFLDVTLDMNWRNGDRLVHVGQLKPGERNTQWRQTYVGHEFALVHPNGTTYDFKITTEEFFRIGQFPSAIGSRQDPTRAQLERLESSEKRRLAQIKVNFTADGYKRIKTPRQLLGDIRRFFNVNRERAFHEDMGGSIHINTWKADSAMVPPSFATKHKWHAWFQPVLEAWAQTQLEPTDLYGIRTYHRGAVLLPHIDRHATHAVSAIINVEQRGVDKDWDLEIFNIQGDAIYSDLQTGQAMLYESAHCVHGRPEPFQGESYTNVFFHYRPLNDPEWFKHVVPGSNGKYAGPAESAVAEADEYDAYDEEGDDYWEEDEEDTADDLVGELHEEL
ncbi:Hypothetical Protein FCC1311_094182 [Hondaea fermentalgiana]|uniref:Uncharacterized protein n=1 Tax=Hondaea fermentalgiana TaxID=2315210 RepID=A0A2R5GYW1_9STRA|nr:Hypothetical Protein FCC1311_094182 [Hondaea fermentalgiana]|eukprot:GBG33194.1 Hypothetical Protein FCC1311_094182 [Hondaea fermentalgiana]